MPGAGLEPAGPFGQWILSPSRLPSFATRAGSVTPYPEGMRRLILVVAAVIGVRAVLAYRAKRLAAGESALGLDLTD